MRSATSKAARWTAACPSPPAPGAQLEQGSRVGNFVEVKNATGAGAKANHLTYLGDADVGAAPISAQARSPATMTAI
jgi:hypothetical protein